MKAETKIKILELYKEAIIEVKRAPHGEKKDNRWERATAIGEVIEALVETGHLTALEVEQAKNNAISEGKTFTENEMKVLKAIAKSDFYDGDGSIVWDFSVLDTLDLEPAKRGGVFSALEKRGTIEITQPRPRKKGMIVLDSTAPEFKFGTYRIKKAGSDMLKIMGVFDENGFLKK